MGYRTEAAPPGFIVGEVCVTRGLLRGKAIHHLMLVKRAVLPYLVNYKHIPFFGSVGEEHVNVVAVHALSATDIAVVIMHGGLPRFAVCSSTTAHTAFSILYTDVIAVYTAVAHLVVAGLFLRLRRLSPAYFRRSCAAVKSRYYPASSGCAFKYRSFRTIALNPISF